jgi:hypothetical protein
VHTISCDMCGTDALKTPKPQMITSWPEVGGSSIKITLNQNDEYSRYLLICPKCTREHKFLPQTTDDMRRLNRVQTEETLDKFADFIINQGRDLLEDIAKDCMPDDGY